MTRQGLRAVIGASLCGLSCWLALFALLASAATIATLCWVGALGTSIGGLCILGSEDRP